MNLINFSLLYNETKGFYCNWADAALYCLLLVMQKYHARVYDNIILNIVKYLWDYII